MDHRRLALVCALVAGLATPAFAAHYLQAEPKEFPREGARRLRIEFPVGKLVLEGDDGSTIRVLVRVVCRERDYDDCRDEARRVRIDHHVSGDTFVLEFSGIRKNLSGRNLSVEARILAPRTMAADLEMGVGELTTRDMAGDIEAELGVGELQVRAEQRDYGEAEAESGVGDASIRTDRGTVRDRGFIGHTARWNEGRGSGSIRAHVGVGEARIELR